METKRIRFQVKTLMGKMRDEGRHCTLETIADATGLHMSNLSMLSTNKTRMVRLDTLELLCAYFDCALSDLMVLE